METDDLKDNKVDQEIGTEWRAPTNIPGTGTCSYWAQAVDLPEMGVSVKAVDLKRREILLRTEQLNGKLLVKMMREGFEAVFRMEDIQTGRYRIFAGFLTKRVLANDGIYELTPAQNKNEEEFDIVAA